MNRTRRPIPGKACGALDTTRLAAGRPTVRRRLCLPFLLLSLCLSGCDNNDPIVVGFLGGITGSASALGTPARDGALLAVEQVNAAGGIGGRQVQLIVKDDAGDFDTARASVTELIALEVEAIIGPETSSIAMATVDLTNQSQMLMLSPTVTTTQLTGRDDYFLRTNTPADRTARSTARYHYNQLGHRQFAATYDLGNRSYSESWLTAFVEEFEALGGEIVATVPFTSGDATDLAGLSNSLLEPNPQAVLIVAGAVDAATLCQHLRLARPETSIVISEWAVASDDFIALGGASVEGVYSNRFLDPDDKSPEYLEFVETYRSRFDQTPGFASVSTYEATNILIDGLKRKKADRHIRDVILEKRQYPGVQGPLHIDEFGDTVRKNFLVQIRNGVVVSLGEG